MEDPSKYWNKLAGNKKFTVQFQPDLILPRLPKSARILDYGCGYGRTLTEIKNAGFDNLFGADISSAMLSMARKALPDVEFSDCQNFLTPWESESFDLVILIAVLTSVVDTQDQKQLINEAMRLLRPGGYIYVSDFLINSDPRNIDRYCKFQPKYGLFGIFETPDGGLLRHHDINYIYSLLEKFEQEELVDMRHETMNGHSSNGFAYVGKKPIYP
ncbi:MAG: class I SAM-dependent methyltransferase [Lentisphaerae bacterium]|nr:class I SAM-dependent methyltransferase [Lentisphaerota bacterium]MCP4100154.1 class I SAM-dependent methyltransferase [Lentisphaerota bacterium]